MTTILIVDDEKSMRDFLKILLVKEGYEVIVASDGEQALAALGQNRVDLVISDIRMPGMSGLELLDKIKDEPEDVLQKDVADGKQGFACSPPPALPRIWTR